MTLDHAMEAFLARPQAQTAADYLEQLIVYYQDDMIGDDTFFDGLGQVHAFLRNPFNIVIGGPR